MPPRPKHIPERTCIACRSTHPDGAKQAKRNLVRLVRAPGGDVSVDLTGKKPGRGAYLCADPACWEVGLKKGALERALKVSISPTDRVALEAFAAALETAPAKEPAR